MPLDRVSVRQSLAEFAASDAADTSLRQAAVGIVLGEDPIDGKVRFLLTERPSTLVVHPGQYALPGGTLDPGESHLDALIREVSEEVGLTLEPGDVLGRLDDYQTRSGYAIRPYVAWTDTLDQTEADPEEVACLLRIPVTALTGPAVPTLVQFPGQSQPILQLPLGGNRVIHAPTGALLYQFARWVFDRRRIDMTAFGEPEFAWR